MQIGHPEAGRAGLAGTAEQRQLHCTSTYSYSAPNPPPPSVCTLCNPRGWQRLFFFLCASKLESLQKPIVRKEGKQKMIAPVFLRPFRRGAPHRGMAGMGQVVYVQAYDAQGNGNLFHCLTRAIQTIPARSAASSELTVTRMSAEREYST